MLGLHLYVDRPTGFDLEDDGSTHAEIERVYYGLISDKGWTQLKAMGQGERQEQWSYKTDKGSCRVRAYHDTNTYEVTVKNDNTETNSLVSKDFFTHFKSISDNGMIKNRYSFPIDTSGYSSEDKEKWKGLKWEVDVFILPNGEFAPWCKIDLEVHSEDQLNDGTRPEFPIDFKEVIVNEGDAKKLVRKLYEDYFITKNTEVSMESDVTEMYRQLIETRDMSLLSNYELESMDIDLESFLGDIKAGAKNLWEKLLALLDKLLDWFKNTEVVRKQRCDVIKQNLKEGKLYHVRTPVTGDTLTDVFAFPTNLLKNLPKHIDSLITDIGGIKDKSKADEVVERVKKTFTDITSETAAIVKKDCGQTIDAESPRLVGDWLQTKQIRVGKNEESTIKTSIDFITKETRQLHNKLDELRKILHHWVDGDVANLVDNVVLDTIYKLITVVKSIINMANPHSIVIKMVDGISTEQYDMEGIGDILVGGVVAIANTLGAIYEGGMSIVQNRSKKPGMQHSNEDNLRTKEADAARAKVKGFLESHYLNDRWLSNQKFVTGDVSGTYSKAFSLEGKNDDPFGNIEKADKNLGKVLYVWNGIVDSLSENILDHDEDVAIEASKIETKEPTTALWKKAVVDLQHIIDDVPWNKFPNKTMLTGNVSLVLKDNKITHVVEPTLKDRDTLPALGKDGVKKAAQLIKDIMFSKKLSTYGLEMYGVRGGPSVINRAETIAPGCTKEYLKIGDEERLDNIFVVPINRAINTLELIRALEHWINASIK